MITSMSDPYWQSLLLGAGAHTPWLRDHGSLTRRIQKRCSRFGVNPIRSEIAPVEQDERVLLGATRAYTREVFLLADDRPVVFAHSVVASHHLRGAWQPVQHLGSRPLGALLFAHPLVQRAPLRFRALDRRSELYRRAADALFQPPARLWARRSEFRLHGAPLLVTEVFLPDILNLPK
jgi:chorismate--pyruvate lyase